MLRYFTIYKPYQVLSQFSASGEKRTLAGLPVPKDVYPVGRLDYDSEGLLLLTSDTSINHRLLHPANAHEREYWVQVEGAVTAAVLQSLQQGIIINIDGHLYTTKKCKAEVFPADPAVPERIPPIRFRRNIPASWIKLILQEGKNRQVRKMTAAAGFPTLRLIRYRISHITLEGLQPGEIMEWERETLFKALFGS